MKFAAGHKSPNFEGKDRAEMPAQACGEVGSLPEVRHERVTHFKPEKRRMSRFLLLGLTAGLGIEAVALRQAMPAAAQETPPQTPDDARRALEQKRLELQQTEGKAKSLQTDLVELESERERLNSRLVETAALIQRSEAQMTSIEGRLSELEVQEKVVRGSLDQREGQISALLGALQRMGRNPPPVMITRREDALQMVRSAMLLSSAFPELRTQALRLAERLSDLQRVMSDIRSEGQRLEAETARLNEARTRLASLMEAKKLTQADRQSQLEAVRQASVDISKNVDDLSELISRLDKTVAEKTNLGAYDQQLKQASALGGPPAEATPAGPQKIEPPKEAENGTQVAMLQPHDIKPPAVELAPQGAVIHPGSPLRMEPAIPFSTARAKLPLPAHGRRLLAYGDKTQFGGHSKGMVMETRFSAQVTAPCDGWVLYAGEFRSYGQLLIIDAGDGYHMLLAGMSQIDVAPGQFVLTSEPVGTMGAGPSKGSQEAQPSAPVLYIELRKDERPIDPEPWWVPGQQKVQG